jgi:hypothetical protein
MNKAKTTQPILNKAIIVGMGLLFILLQIGFHPTYLQYFPEFEKFTWLHHIHGALMASWIMLLVVQPVLIHKGLYKAHRFIGKLSYIIGPLMIVSMCLILKFTYHKHVLNSSLQVVMSNQSPIIMQLFSFTVLYCLAIFYRKHTFYHMRFMIGTALLMIIPIVGRIFFEYFAAEFWYDLYLSVGIALILLTYDILKKEDWKPYAIVTLILLSILIVYHARYSETWEVFGRFVVDTFY